MHFCIRYHWNLHNIGTCACLAEKIHTSPYWVPWGFCGPWPWVYHSCSGRCLHQRFPQIKRSVLLSGSLMKPWGDMNPSRVPVDYQMSSGPWATAFCPLSPVVRLVSSGAGGDCPSHPPACSQEWCLKTSAKSRQFTSAAFHIPHSLLSQPRGQL